MTVRKWIHQMHTGVQYFACVLTLILLVVIQVTPAYAAVTKTNSDTNYEMIIDDVAGYFSDDEMQSLTDLMVQITDYCNVAVVTTESHGYSTTRRLAQAYFDDSFGIHASGSVFVIDRDLNEIYLYSAGDAYKTITSARATSITDNTYIYATASYGRDYYKCSYETMRQVLTLLEGRRIAEPMRYTCSALLAIILALLINYFIVMFYSRSRKESDKAILGGIYSGVNITNPNAVFTSQSKRYSPPSSSSGSGGSSGGGGGGGGHSSGGGGGHSI